MAITRLGTAQVDGIAFCRHLNGRTQFKVKLKTGGIFPTGNTWLTIIQVTDEVREMVFKFYAKHGEVLPVNIDTAEVPVDKKSKQIQQNNESYHSILNPNGKKRR